MVLRELSSPFHSSSEQPTTTRVGNNTGINGIPDNSLTFDDKKSCPKYNKHKLQKYQVQVSSELVSEGQLTRLPRLIKLSTLTFDSARFAVLGLSPAALLVTVG